MEKLTDQRIDKIPREKGDSEVDHKMLKDRKVSANIGSTILKVGTTKDYPLIK